MTSMTTKRSVWLAVLGLAISSTAIIVASECLSNASTGSAGSWLAAPATSVSIAAPRGATVVAHFKAKGVQIYACSAGAPEPAGARPAFAWTLRGPEAELFDAAGGKVGTHAAGPVWSLSADRSSVRGTKVAQTDAPTPGAIAWLLMKGSMGTGKFAPVTWIQRVNTTAGQAPPNGCDAAASASKKEMRVDYAADYFFYQGGQAP